MRSPGAANRGFTLIETLAAFAILAMTLGQLLHSIGTSADNERRADFLIRASTAAQSHIAAIGVEFPIQTGRTTGQYPNGLYWTLDIKSREDGNNLHAYSVSITVHDRDGWKQKFSITTVKIAPSLQSAPL